MIFFVGMDKPNKIKELWNKAAVHYNKHMADTGHYSAQQSLYGLLKNNFKSPILELASGPGFLASLLLKDEHNVTLNDFSPKMHDFFKKELNKYPNARFSNQNATDFTFDNKFKTIVSCNLFYYLQNREAAIKHWGKYLDLDGVIILFEEYPFQKPESKEMDNYEEKLMSLIDPISPDQIKEIFNKNNFKLIEQKSVPIDLKHDLFAFVFKKS